MSRLEIVYAGKGPVGEACRERLARQVASFSDIGLSVPQCDLLLSVHWPRKFGLNELARCRIGALNLHNGFLPYGRGADTCSWAIALGTPHGVTMHWMTEQIDEGPIYMQTLVEVMPGDTADELYQRTAKVEVELFDQAVMQLMTGDFRERPQEGRGTWFVKGDFNRLVRAVTTDKYEVRERGKA